MNLISSAGFKLLAYISFKILPKEPSKTEASLVISEGFASPNFFATNSATKDSVAAAVLESIFWASNFTSVSLRSDGVITFNFSIISKSSLSSFEAISKAAEIPSATLFMLEATAAPSSLTLELNPASAAFVLPKALEAASAVFTDKPISLKPFAKALKPSSGTLSKTSKNFCFTSESRVDAKETKFDRRSDTFPSALLIAPINSLISSP